MWQGKDTQLRVILSGGGTGGHIFPAIAVANELKRINPANEVLFIGAAGRMEMQKVPQAGYPIIGLNIRGLQRRLSLDNLLLPYRLLSSIWHAIGVFKNFNPHCAIGFGGYASGPTLFAAKWLKVPYLLQEQNSYAGITNKLLAPGAKAVCVAYEGMEKYFKHTKVLLTGNPVRHGLENVQALRSEALAHFGLQADKPVVLLMGGSLGARTINEAAHQSIEKWLEAGMQVIWQTGKNGYSKALATWGQKSPEVKLLEFITEVALAYAAADVIVSRAGALTISELCLVGKPSILVPSPNVAEDHQTKNAQALVRAQAALMIADHEAGQKLADAVLQLAKNVDLSAKLGENIKSLAKPQATHDIVAAMYQSLNLNPTPYAA